MPDDHQLVLVDFHVMIQKILRGQEVEGMIGEEGIQNLPIIATTLKVQMMVIILVEMKNLKKGETQRGEIVE